MGNAFQHAAGIGSVVVVAAVINGVHNAAAVGGFNNKLNFSAGGIDFFARMVDGFGIRDRKLWLHGLCRQQRKSGG